MRPTLLASVLLCFGFAACADHSGTVRVAQDGPEAPVNRPDTEVIGGGQSGAEPVTSGENGNGSGPTSGGGTGSGPGPQPGGGGGGGNPPSQGAGGGQGAGAPVPEPGTLLLVGSGLAGAALLRRRKAAAKA